MANPKRTVLGVEIGAREVRMVEMRSGVGQPQILKAGSVPLPAGAMDGDRIVQIEAVADLLRGLHGRLGCQARAAIVGMGVQSVVTRILAIPRVPENELRTVIEGELAHYQILQSGTGAFDFFRLDATSFSADALPSVLLMATEERIAQGYRIAVEKAGLQLLALEPITLSLFRSAYPMLEKEPAALCLAVTPQRSELSILDHTQLRIYRRMEIGSNDFIAGRGRSGQASAPGGPVNLAGDTGPMDSSGTRPARTLLGNTDDDITAELSPSGLPGGTSTGGTGPLPPMGGANMGDIIPQAAASLSNEVQRSLDYYRREYPNSTAIGRIILATNDPDAEALSDWLSQSLRMDVRVVETPTDAGLPPQTVTQLEAPQGLRFLGAAGAALHALTPDWKQVPRLNLAVGGQSERAVPLERDRLTASMILSLCLLFGGFFFAYLFNRNATIQRDKMIKSMRELDATQKEVAALQQRIVDEKRLKAIIGTDGLPVPEIMDLIAGNVPAQVGLYRVAVARDGKITIEGRARRLDLFNEFNYKLTQCPKLTPPLLGPLSTEDPSNIVHFTVDTAFQGTQAAGAKK